MLLVKWTKPEKICQGTKILPGVTGDSEIDTRGSPHLPSDRVGTQYKTR